MDSDVRDPLLSHKHAIAYQIRTLTEFLKKHIGEREAHECIQLMVKLTEDRFLLAVVGQFKRGKSSLMNAVIGRNILPTGVLPLTSAITVLKYGTEEKLTILREGSVLPEEVDISNLAEYVTEKGNPGNRKKVVRACLELPLPFLQRGLEFVDTPGIGSAIEENTATTYRFLPQSDAVIFVTSVDTPLTRTEIDFLKSIRRYVRKIFFVVNKIDLVGEAERQEIIAFVSEKLRQVLQADTIRVFPVSSTQSLSAQNNGNTTDLEQCGLKIFEEALIDFFSVEKSNVFLVSILDKLLDITANASRELDLLRLAVETSQEESKRVLSALKARFQELHDSRSKLLQEMEDRILHCTREAASVALDSFVADEARALIERLDAALSQSPWKLSFLFSDDFAQHLMPKVRKDLNTWTMQQMKQLESQGIELLHRERTALEENLRRIPAAAAEVLGLSEDGAVSDGDAAETSDHWAAVIPDFDAMDLTPRASLLLGFFPVMVVKPLLRRRLADDLHRLMSSCKSRLDRAFEESTQGAIQRTASAIQARAAELEARIIQAIQGKRLSKGIDGRYRITELRPEELHREIDTLHGIEKKLVSIRTEMLKISSAAAGEHLAEDESHTAEPALPSPAPPGEFGISAASGGPLEEKPDVSRDLGTRGCPVCGRMIEAADSFFAHYQYDLATEEHAQQAHAASLGFCPLHTWQLAAIASPVGLSQGYPRLMERLSIDLSKLAAAQDSGLSASVMALVQDSKRCRVCRLLRETENAYLKDLSAFLQKPEGHKAYIASQGICLQHLGMIVRHVSPPLARFLIEHAAQRFCEISDHMQNYALKRDALRRYMLSPNEQDAYLRGLIQSVGERKLCFP